MEINQTVFEIATRYGLWISRDGIEERRLICSYPSLLGAKRAARLSLKHNPQCHVAVRSIKETLYLFNAKSSTPVPEPGNISRD